MRRGDVDAVMVAVLELSRWPVYGAIAVLVFLGHRCAVRPAWSAQKLADMEGAFAQIGHVMEKRRLDDLAEVGPTVPPVTSSVVPAVLGAAGAMALVAAVAGS